MTADLGPAATPRPIPTMEDRMSRPDRIPAPRTTAERELEEAMSILARIGDAISPTGERPEEALGTLAADVEVVVRQRDELAIERTNSREVLAQAGILSHTASTPEMVDLLAAQRDDARQQLGRAQETLATLRHLDERRDRAWAAHDTVSEPSPSPGSPAPRAQEPGKPCTGCHACHDDQTGTAAETDVPDWVLILIRGLAKYEHDHPKLYRYKGAEQYEPFPCPGGLLEGVPASVRERAERAEA